MQNVGRTININGTVPTYKLNKYPSCEEKNKGGVVSKEPKSSKLFIFVKEAQQNVKSSYQEAETIKSQQLSITTRTLSISSVRSIPNGSLLFQENVCKEKGCKNDYSQSQEHPIKKKKE